MGIKSRLTQPLVETLQNIECLAVILIKLKLMSNFVKHLSITLAFGLLGLIPQSTWAYQIDFGAFYFSDSLNPGTEQSNNRMFIEAAIGMPLSKKSNFVLSWAVTKLSYTLESAATTEISTLEHGPRIGWYIDKRRFWSIFATYNLFATGTFNAGSGELEWRGNSFKFDFGITPQITESLQIGVRLNYYSASYDEQFDASSTFSVIDTSQSMIFPSFNMTYNF